MKIFWEVTVDHFLDKTLPKFFPDILISVLVISLFIFLRSLAIRLARKNIQNTILFARFKRAVNITFYLLSFSILFPLWLPSLRNAATFLGIFGAGVLIVFKEILLNIIGWIYLLVRRPFHVGDRVQMGNLMGDVIDIKIFEISLIEVSPSKFGFLTTGRIAHIPNNRIFTDPILNATKEYSVAWTQIQLPITVDSNWQLAETLMLETANQLQLNSQELKKRIIYAKRRILYARNDYSISHAEYNPTVFMEIKNNYICLTLRILVEPLQIHIIHDKFWREFLDRIKNETDIKIIEAIH